MPVHVAILLKPYLDLILSGEKTIESRLTKSPLPPFEQIEAGERIYFKQSSGPYRGTAVAAKVASFRDLTPPRIATLRDRYNDEICGEAAFWQWKRNARFATLVYLRDVEACDVGPSMPPSRGRAWFVLDDAADPGFEVTLTAGAIRNGYVRLSSVIAHLPSDCLGGATASDAARPIRLLLPGDDAIETDIVAPGTMMRWRGWRRLFASHRLSPGDRVRFVRVKPREYRVSFLSAWSDESKHESRLSTADAS